MRGAIPPLPQYVFVAWCLVKHRDNFTFTFNIFLILDLPVLFKMLNLLLSVNFYKMKFYLEANEWIRSTRRN
jgi:hypothetical protein